jgi:hypothetical protein
MAEIITFDGALKRYAAKPAPSQLAVSVRDRGRFGNNQHTRRACLRMLLYGMPFRSVARKHPGREEGLAQDVRDALLSGGMAA